MHYYSLEEFGLSEEWVQEKMSDIFDKYGF